MIFELERTSAWSVWGNKSPSKRATKCTKQCEKDILFGKDENGNKWYKRCTIPKTFYTIEINTLEELLDFMSKEGNDLIIKNNRNFDNNDNFYPKYPKYAIEIYDTDRE